jgi:hypothetical protein
MCLAHGCDCLPISNQSKVGVALSTIGQNPINGLRHPVTAGTTGWYIWCGEEFWDAPDFFLALCVEHLLESLPTVMPGGSFSLMPRSAVKELIEICHRYDVLVLRALATEGVD